MSEPGDIQAKIREIENEMSRTQKNKATNYHLGTLKAKIAKLKSELVNGPGGKSSGSKDAGRGFEVSKSGDTRIGLVGFPSVGKSTLLTSLTGTASEAAAYEFTTLTCIPGTMTYRGARVQVLDLPGIIEGAADGKGRGRQVISTARTCNLILIVLDSAKPLTHKKLIEAELFNFGIRINQEPPNVMCKLGGTAGGVSYQEVVLQTKGLSPELARVVLKEYKISSAEIIVREDITVDQFIDVIEGNRKYMPVLYVFNKIDQITVEELEILDQIPNYVPISSGLKWNLDELMESIWDRCNMMRIYTKPKGAMPDYDEPVILHANNPTIEQLCNRLHRSLIDQFSYAWVWGSSCKHSPMRCGKDHVLEDEDVIQIVKKTG
jgi:small GTP-binding protein